MTSTTTTTTTTTMNSTLSSHPTVNIPTPERLKQLYDALSSYYSTLNLQTMSSSTTLAITSLVENLEDIIFPSAGYMVLNAAPVCSPSVDCKSSANTVWS